MSGRILVIDDEANIRRMMRFTLEADGYEVEDAPDGPTGLEAFGDGSRFDAIILDQKMPGMEGTEVLRQIRSRAPQAAVIMATAFASIALAVDAMKLGATDFLRKPLTPEALRGAVLAAASKGSARARPPAVSGAPAVPAGAFSEVWTVNGFFIRFTASDDATGEHRFTVRHAGKGPHGDVVVRVSATEISRVTRVTGRQVPLPTAFWRQLAERVLMNHLFREAALPSGNHLSVDHVTEEAVLLAREWKGD